MYSRRPFTVHLAFVLRPFCVRLPFTENETQTVQKLFYDAYCRLQNTPNEHLEDAHTTVQLYTSHNHHNAS